MSVLTIVVLSVVLAMSQGAFYTLVDETCDALKNPTSEFDSLFGCAKYVTNNTEMRCLNKDEIPNALAAVPEWKFSKLNAYLSY